MAHLLTRATAAGAAAALALASAIITFTVVQPHPGHSAASPVDTTDGAEDRARRAVAAMPLSFEANRGQVSERVRYLARGQGFTLFLTPRGAVFDLRAPEPDRGSTKRSTPAAAVFLDPVGADPEPRVVGRRYQQATSSYFVGDRSTWRRGVTSFGRVRYRDLYPGIDMVFRGDRSGAEYDFVVAPGSDPDRIGYRLRGADALRISGGDLVAATAAGDFVHRAPVAYQLIDGERRTVDAEFRLAHGVVSFDLGTYDRRLPLVIDPETDLEYSTYLGGSSYDEAEAIVLDGGDAYLAGTTYSPEFPTTIGAYDSTESFSDAFVSRISLDGAGPADLVYSTFIGGAFYDHGRDLAVENGDVYLTGSTESSDFPTTAGAYDTDFRGNYDHFVVKISPDGAGAADLAYSTLLGGGDYSGGGQAIAVAGGDAWVTGTIDNPSYPTTPGAPHHESEGDADVTLSRISPDGAGAADLVYSAVFGGDGDQGGNDLVLGGGDVFITGSTYYGGFPTTAGAYDRTYNGEYDAFLARVSPDGEGKADIKYATYLGTPGDDVASGLAVRDGVVTLTGTTDSARFRTTRGAFDRSYNGKGDAFLARISTRRTVERDLRYSTYLGGSRADSATSVVLKRGKAYVVGRTASPTFPTKAGSFDRSHNGNDDAFVAMFSPTGNRAGDLDYATFLGGPKNDEANAIAVDGTAVYVTGAAGKEFPTTVGAFDPTYNEGPDDAFLAMLRLP